MQMELIDVKIYGPGWDWLMIQSRAQIWLMYCMLKSMAQMGMIGDEIQGPNGINWWHNLKLSFIRSYDHISSDFFKLMLESNLRLRQWIRKYLDRSCSKTDWSYPISDTVLKILLTNNVMEERIACNNSLILLRIFCYKNKIISEKIPCERERERDKK